MRKALAFAAFVITGGLFCATALAVVGVPFDLKNLVLAFNLSFYAAEAAPRAKPIGKFSLQTTLATASLGHLLAHDGVLDLQGNLVRKKPRPADPPATIDFWIPLPLLDTSNTSATKLSAKLDETQFGAALQGQVGTDLNAALNRLIVFGLNGPTKKAKFNFYPGDLEITSGRSAGSLSVDKKSFTKVTGSVNVPLNVRVTSGPHVGATGKGKLSASFKGKRAPL